MSEARQSTSGRLAVASGVRRPYEDREVLVEARGLGVKRDGRMLVSGVDLEVRRGEIVTLIGPNGGGKTTTVRAALGLISHEAGSVTRRPGLRIGYVPQRLAIDRTLPLTVGRFLQLTRSVPQSQVAATLARVGLSGFEHSAIQDLSGGEFQRVLLARAIVSAPDLLVLDEPVQGVDLNGEIALYELIGALRAEFDCGILLISHDLHVVMAATDTVLCINGHVCCSGTAETVQASPEYHRLFGHRAAETLAVYRHRHDHTHDGRLGIVPGANATAPAADCDHCGAGHEGHGHDGHGHGDHSHDHGHDGHGHRHAGHRNGGAGDAG